MARQFISSGFAPEGVARQVFEAIQDDRFYIIPVQPHMLDAVSKRFENLLNSKNPEPSQI